MRRYPDPEYFKLLQLLDDLQQGTVPSYIDKSVAYHQLVTFLQQVLGAN